MKINDRQIDSSTENIGLCVINLRQADVEEKPTNLRQTDVEEKPTGKNEWSVL